MCDENDGLIGDEDWGVYDPRLCAGSGREGV